MDFSNIRAIKERFEDAGGEFITSLSVFTETLPAIKAFIFDWDGVFNDGFKQDNLGSPFSEPSSMGINMLRFGSYLKTKEIPLVFIITGENNLTAVKLANREHFSAVFVNARNKLDALQHISAQFGMEAKQMAFVFDDILDLGLASKVALRFQVKRKAGPLTDAFVKKNKLADYITANSGNQHAVREICELSMGFLGNFEQTITERMHFSEAYQKYLTQRNQIKANVFDTKTGRIKAFVKD